MKLCKQQMPDSSGFYYNQCSRNASTEAGYCKQHDPELKKARSKARPPVKSDRQREARTQLTDYLASVLTVEQIQIVERGIRWGYCDWISPPWPIDITKQEDA